MYHGSCCTWQGDLRVQNLTVQWEIFQRSKGVEQVLVGCEKFSKRCGVMWCKLRMLWIICFSLVFMFVLWRSSSATVSPIVTKLGMETTLLYGSEWSTTKYRYPAAYITAIAMPNRSHFGIPMRTSLMVTFTMKRQEMILFWKPLMTIVQKFFL